MKIDAGTEILLFRFKNFRDCRFIKEHLSVLRKNDYVWLLKVGKKTSISKLHSILKDGGWMLLRAPKNERGEYFLARYEEISEIEPVDGIYPKYYREILEADNDEVFGYEPTYQWFKITYLKELDKEYDDIFVLSKTGKNINRIIPTTRTAIMFIKTVTDIIL